MVKCIKKIGMLALIVAVFVTAAVGFACGFDNKNLGAAYADEIIDYTPLEDAVNRTKGLAERNYSTASWAKMSAALINANIALELKDSPTQDAVETLAKALNDAIDALKVDKTALLEIILKSENIIESRYEPDSILDLQYARREVLLEAYDKIPQYRVDELYEILNDAYNSLVRLIDCPNNVTLYLNEVFEIEVLPAGGSWSYDESFFGIDEETGKLVPIKSGTTEMTYTTLQGVTKTVSVSIIARQDYATSILLILGIVAGVILSAIGLFVILRKKAG